MQTTWKTTTLGVLAIIGTVVSIATSALNGHMPDLAALAQAWAAVAAGWGLIHAADSKPKV